MILRTTCCHGRTAHTELSADIHHNETLSTLSGGSQLGKIELTEVRLG